MAALFAAAVAFRPLMPIDETRYLSVAWEMHLKHGWLEPLTMNFQPYHHKPPLLFWLINLCWSVFGVSRWAGSIPPALSTLAVIFLTGRLGQLLFPSALSDPSRVRLVMMGSAPFLIYGTLVLFDLTLTVFVLVALIAVILYSRERRPVYLALLGLCLGLGVLTKGPVAYLYVLFPFLLAPLWVPDFQKRASWYGGLLIALGLSVLPILLWLVPVLRQSDGNFAFWLVWNQTAGRVTGNFSEAHNRPFWFYLPLVPVMTIPWIFFPAFWRGAKELRHREAAEPGLRFLLCWMVPVFVCFCLISGKQPHYMVPLLPGVMLAVTLVLAKLSTRVMAVTLAVMLAAGIGAEAVASRTTFVSYDLEPVASYIKAHPGHDLAFVRSYHGELGFLARLDRPVADLEQNQLAAWFREHPDGLAVIRYKEAAEVAAFRKLVDSPYRGKRMGIFSLH